MEEQDIAVEGEKKIVVVGHTGCGKTSLIASFVSERPVGMTEPTSNEIRKLIDFGREWVHVVLREEQSVFHLSLDRILEYRGASAVLVCFAFDDMKSIKSLPKWIDEARKFCGPADVFVVGCKLDRKHKTAVSAEEWTEMERSIPPYIYLECSAKTGEGVSHLVRVVGNALLNREQRENDSAVQH